MPHQWLAQLKDKTQIKQFDNEGKTTWDNGENSFQLVTDAEKQNNLDIFFVIAEKNTFAVDLNTGFFYIDNIALDPAPELTMKKEKYRIIYWRQRREQRGPQKTREGIYLNAILLGWQVLINGANHQRMMFITPNNSGNYTVEIRKKH